VKNIGNCNERWEAAKPQKHFTPTSSGRGYLVIIGLLVKWGNTCWAALFCRQLHAGLFLRVALTAFLETKSCLLALNALSKKTRPPKKQPCYKCPCIPIISSWLLEPQRCYLKGGAGPFMETNAWLQNLLASWVASFDSVSPWHANCLQLMQQSTIGPWKVYAQLVPACQWGPCKGKPI